MFYFKWRHKVYKKDNTVKKLYKIRVGVVLSCFVFFQIRSECPARAITVTLNTVLYTLNIYTQYSKYCIAVIIPSLHQFFRKFEKIFGSWRQSWIFFRRFSTLSPWYLQNRFFRFTLCSSYWMQVLIPRLYQFLRKFGEIFWSWRPSLIFFRQIRTLSPW